MSHHFDLSDREGLPDRCQFCGVEMYGDHDEPACERSAFAARLEEAIRTLDEAEMHLARGQPSDRLDWDEDTKEARRILSDLCRQLLMEQDGLSDRGRAPDHRWSGWPGAWCLDCGAEDLIETVCCVKHDLICPGTPECTNPPCPEPGSNRHNPYKVEEKVRVFDER